MMPDKLMEFGRTCFECALVLGMSTKKNIQEMGWIKFFLAQFIMATFVVVPLLMTISYYGGKVVNSVEILIIDMDELKSQVNRNSITVDQIKSDLEEHKDNDQHGDN
jgi:hypothetical protein